MSDRGHGCQFALVCRVKGGKDGPERRETGVHGAGGGETVYLHSSTDGEPGASRGEARRGAVKESARGGGAEEDVLGPHDSEEGSGACA